MPTSTSLTPPILALPDSPPPRKARGFTDVRLEQGPSPHRSFRRESDLSLLPSAPPSIRLRPRSPTDPDLDAILTLPPTEDAEDEYTLSAYGDISLSEIFVPPLPASPRSSSDPSQPRFLQPRLRLKMQRPPMPKRRISYASIADPLPCDGDVEFDEYWPGSPRLINDNTSWLQHQLLMSPLPMDPPNSQRGGHNPTENGGESLERLIEELLPRSPSIRLSPPGSPAAQAISLPQEARGPKSGVKSNQLEVNDAPAILLRSGLLPAPQKEKYWRTRLPQRPPIPKWDV